MGSSDKPGWVPEEWAYCEDAEFIAGEWSWFVESKHESCGGTVREWTEPRYFSAASRALLGKIKAHECP